MQCQTPSPVFPHSHTGHSPHLSACVESVHTALAALGPVSRLPPLSSRPFPRPPSFNSSGMDRGWMTGWLIPSPSSLSGLGSPSGSRPRSTACWACVMARWGWALLPSLKWVCSRELMYSTTLDRRAGKNSSSSWMSATAKHNPCTLFSFIVTERPLVSTSFST